MVLGFEFSRLRMDNINSSNWLSTMALMDINQLGRYKPMLSQI